MKSQLQRLNNIQGQIEGVKKMIDHKSDCLDILTQLKAVRSAVNSVIDTVIEEQFNTCLKTVSSQDKQLLIKIKKYVQSN